MRRAAWVLLLGFAFAIPWEYSLDLGAPLGNVARLAGLAVLAAAVPAVLARGRLQTPGPVQSLGLALLLWVCASWLWSLSPDLTWVKMRGFAQEIMIAWLVWEFVDDARAARALVRSFLAGEFVLAALTLADFWTGTSGQVRFAAYGQDPNDVARFLDLGFPLAALLVHWEGRWWSRMAAGCYVPVGLAAVILTASRGGAVALVAALGGSGFLLLRGRRRVLLAWVSAAVVLAGLVWALAPPATRDRLATVLEPLRGGDLNQRANIWEAGWRAFTDAPWLGHGAGSFVDAAGLASIDTAHNTALSLAVEMGLVGLGLMVAVVAAAVWSAAQTRGDLRAALGTLLLVWGVSSLVGTVAESRTTWLLLGLAAVCGRLERDAPGCFALRPLFPRRPALRPAEA